MRSPLVRSSLTPPPLFLNRAFPLSIYLRTGTFISLDVHVQRLTTVVTVWAFCEPILFQPVCGTSGRPGRALDTCQTSFRVCFVVFLSLSRYYLIDHRFDLTLSYTISTPHTPPLHRSNTSNTATGRSNWTGQGYHAHYHISLQDRTYPEL